MTQDEFDAYLPKLIEEYAQERATAGGTPIEQEREASRGQIGSLLKDGLATAHQHLWRLVAAGDAPAGILWVDVNEDEHRAFIYDFMIVPELRGKGYGRQALEAMETALRDLGVTRVALSVFGHNHVARRLYEHTGYDIVALHMQKEI
jgi:GNAT superfamily N-acetyltransferase